MSVGGWMTRAGPMSKNRFGEAAAKLVRLGDRERSRSGMLGQPRDAGRRLRRMEEVYVVAKDAPHIR